MRPPARAPDAGVSVKLDVSSSNKPVRECEAIAHTVTSSHRDCQETWLLVVGLGGSDEDGAFTVANQLSAGGNSPHFVQHLFD